MRIETSEGRASGSGSISVVIPVLNESETIESVIELARRGPGVVEVIVIDDGSIDGTAELAARMGVRVLTSTLLGKGASMDEGVQAAVGEIVVFLDGDLSGLRPDLIEVITAPLIRGEADFVKARFARRAGRVTVIAARPLLNTFFPELSHIEQPLGGIVAARRDVLRGVRFETDYGVDVGLLLDVAAAGARIVQVDIGNLEHQSQSLDQLGDMAKQVVRVILQRAASSNRLDIAQMREVEEVERHAQAEVSLLLGRIGQPDRVALIDMDGTLLNGRFIVALAERTGRTEELKGLLDHPSLDAGERTRRIARIFTGLQRSVFEETARNVPLMPGAVDLVLHLRKRGYRVGVVTDSFMVAGEIVRRRVFADFCVAHLMRFRHDVATGEVTLCPAMRRENGCPDHPLCKLNVLDNVSEHLGVPRERVLAIGDNDPDACMLREAGQSIAFQPKSALVAASARAVVDGDLTDVIGRLHAL